MRVAWHNLRASHSSKSWRLRIRSISFSRSGSRFLHSPELSIVILRPDVGRRISRNVSSFNGASWLLHENLGLRAATVHRSRNIPGDPSANIGPQDDSAYLERLAEAVNYSRNALSIATFSC